MKFAVDRRDALAGSVDVAVSAFTERGEKDEPLPRLLVKEDEALDGLLTAAWKRREIKGRKAEITVFHRPDGRGRLLLVGLGAKATHDAEAVRRAAASAVKALKGRGARTIGFRLATFTGEGVPTETATRAIADGTLLGAYEFLRYRATAEAGVEEGTVFLGEEHGREEAALRRALDQELTLLDSVIWTRDLINLPADTATPERLAEEARHVAKEYGLKVTVFDEKKLEELHCGGILAVGSGSIHPPRMVIVEYGGGARSGKTVAVVGKGITFDSGGISIKPALAMQEMKFDKSGACVALGIVRAAAALKLPPKVIAVMACAENLPSGSSYRPGDVVRTYNGKTIEVLNTDAEGRVVLADALGYVVDKYHPDEVIDLATLTGAEVVALGDDTGALIATDEKLAKGLLSASAITGEPLWRMPLTDFHRELVKSDIADVRNHTELSVAGVLTASAFLETFVGKTAWAHLDIAGPSYTTPSTRKYQPPYQSIGATAFGLRAVTTYLRDGSP
ncbi:MAG: leucyl aminopeptidase [Thermoplasmata archaeon]|nr:leucyl aminopeptidase [Thermoplasmata archaeon]